MSSYLKGDPFNYQQEGIFNRSFNSNMLKIKKRYTDLDQIETKKQRFKSIKQKGLAQAFVRDLQTLSRKLSPIPSRAQQLRRFRDGLRANVREALDTALIMPNNTNP